MKDDDCGFSLRVKCKGFTVFTVWGNGLQRETEQSKRGTEDALQVMNLEFVEWFGALDLTHMVKRKEFALQRYSV